MSAEEKFKSLRFKGVIFNRDRVNLIVACVIDAEEVAAWAFWAVRQIVVIFFWFLFYYYFRPSILHVNHVMWGKISGSVKLGKVLFVLYWPDVSNLTYHVVLLKILQQHTFRGLVTLEEDSVFLFDAAALLTHEFDVRGLRWVFSDPPFHLVFFEWKLEFTRLMYLPH